MEKWSWEVFAEKKEYFLCIKSTLSCSVHSEGAKFGHHHQNGILTPYAPDISPLLPAWLFVSNFPTYNCKRKDRILFSFIKSSLPCSVHFERGKFGHHHQNGLYISILVYIANLIIHI